MLAIALNNPTLSESSLLGAKFVQLFPDFTVIKVSPHEAPKPGPLKLCQPEEYSKMSQEVQKIWDPGETFLELRGPKAKLQKVIRQMFFFDEERKYHKVLLDGEQGLTDFPWALQLAVIPLPAADWEPDPAWLKQMDGLVLDTYAGEPNPGLIEKIKSIRPQLPVYVENLGEGWSPEFKAGMETIFTAYLQTREKIKAELADSYPEPQITCAQARRMAGKHRVSWFLLGNVCDECGYSITNCGLGCF